MILQQKKTKTNWFEQCQHRFYADINHLNWFKYSWSLVHKKWSNCIQKKWKVVVWQLRVSSQEAIYIFCSFAHQVRKNREWTKHIHLNLHNKFMFTTELVGMGLNLFQALFQLLVYFYSVHNCEDHPYSFLLPQCTYKIFIYLQS